MSFFDYLDKVRSRPLQDRKRLLVVWTGLLMIVITVLWISNLLLVLEPVNKEVTEVVATSSEMATFDQVDSPVISSSWRDHLTRIRVGIDAVVEIVQDQVSGEE